MAKVRILRILEYIYANEADAERDQGYWQIPANGTADRGRTVIKSAIITDLNYEDPEVQEGL